MTLPAVNSVEECADYYKTVEPFLPQLYDLPTKLLDSFSDRDALLNLYLETNPFISATALSLFLACIFFIVAEFNRNFSQVDRAWSILPSLYNAHFALWARLSGGPHQRNDLVLAFAAIWSARLTFNYWRKGGYQKGSEDYRWAIVQKYVHPVIFSLFDLTFIAFIQNILIFLFSAAPSYVILLTSRLDPDITTGDMAFFAMEIALVISEFVSDGQQWAFQTAKHKYLDDAKLPRGANQADLDRGFITSGLWAYSRHPNFAAEQLIWFVLYQWGCHSTNTLYNWAGVGAGSLFLLFQGSTMLTEAISSGKYPEYRDYQRAIGRFLPTSLTPYQAPAEVPKASRPSDAAKRRRSKRD